MQVTVDPSKIHLVGGEIEDIDVTISGGTVSSPSLTGGKRKLKARSCQSRARSRQSKARKSIRKSSRRHRK
jgi:hypothetical protein